MTSLVSPAIFLSCSILAGCVANAPTEPGDNGKADGPGSRDGAFVPAPHLAWPQLPDHGGHRLTPLRVVSVMAVDEPYAAGLTAFGDALVQSAWLASWAPEYNIATSATHVVVTGPHVTPGTSYTQDMMNTYIMNAVQAASPAPVPDGKTVYVFYLPPGTVLDNNGTPDNACARASHHIDYGAMGDGMAVLTRCPGGYTSQLEMFEVVAAHEIAEAAPTRPERRLACDHGLVADRRRRAEVMPKGDADRWYRQAVAPARATAVVTWSLPIELLGAGTPAAEGRAINMKKTTKKNILNLSLETIRHLDLDAAEGGRKHQPIYSQGGSCGIICTVGPACAIVPVPGQPGHSLGASCGIICTVGPACAKA
jgi:hypothetical protein